MDDQAQDDKKREFLMSQFHTLRDEILALKERVIRMQLIAISGIPLLVAASTSLNLDFVIIVSPIITAVVILMLSFEQNSIMRAGRYIGKYLEPALKPDNTMGWEEFLEQPSEKNRNAEKYFLASVIIAFALYYIGGAILAFLRIQKISNIYAEHFAIFSGFIYLSLFPFFLYFVTKNFKTSTEVRGDGQN